MAKRVLSMIWMSEVAGSSKLVGRSPSAMTGKSGRHGRGTGGLDLGLDGFDHLEIEIGRHQLDAAVGAGLDQHVGEDRNGVAPLNHGLDMAQAL